MKEGGHQCIKKIKGDQGLILVACRNNIIMSGSGITIGNILFPVGEVILNP